MGKTPSGPPQPQGLPPSEYLFGPSSRPPGRRPCSFTKDGLPSTCLFYPFHFFVTFPSGAVQMNKENIGHRLCAAPPEVKKGGSLPGRRGPPQAEKLVSKNKNDAEQRVAFAGEISATNSL